MSREINLRAGDFTQSTADDCYLSPDDPVHALKLAAATGISPDAALAQHRLSVEQRAWEDRQNSPEMQYAKQYGIRPGTPAWNALWGNS